MNTFKLSRLDIVVSAAALVLMASVLVLVWAGTAGTVGLRVAFMKNSPGGVANVWIADPADTTNARQITFAEDGVYDYGVSPDGHTLIYTEQDFETTAELIRLDLRTGRTSPLTNCRAEDADCTTPVWRPTGGMIAYTRRELNTELNLGASPTRIWLMDLTKNPPSTYPLVEDSQVLGYDPEWSPDGNRLAFYDTASGGILIYDFTAEANGANPLQYIPSAQGSVGTFSPDGTQLIYPELLLTGAPVVHSYLQVADLTTGLSQQLTSPDELADDQAAMWHPTDPQIAIARRYLDERFTRGHQIFLLNVNDLTAEPLVYDEMFNHGFFMWSPQGDQLLMQRVPFVAEGGDPTAARTQIWVYNLASRALTLVMDDAYIPRWVPGDR